MPYVLIAALFLAGCATAPPPKSTKSVKPDCPASVPVPASLVGRPTPAKVSALQIRVELAREAERERGDCWRDAVGGVR